MSKAQGATCRAQRAWRKERLTGTVNRDGACKCANVEIKGDLKETGKK